MISLKSIHMAAEMGDSQTISRLLKGGVFLKKVPVDELDRSGYTALLRLASTKGADNFLNTARVLLDAGADVNVDHEHMRSGYGDDSIFLRALSANNFALARLLILYGTNITKNDINMSKALLLVTKQGDLSFVKFLVAKGAKLSDSKDLKHNALWYAAWNGDMLIIKYFIEEKGFGLGGLDEEGKDILGRAGRNSKNFHEVLEYLWSRSEPIEEIQMDMVKKGDLQGLKKSLEEELSSYRHEARLIEKAVIHGQLAIVKYLTIERKLRYRHTNYSILPIAVENNHSDIVQFLIEEEREEHKEDINKVDYVGTVLIKAINNRNLPMVKYLIDHGSRIDLQDQPGRITTVQAAVNNGDLPMVQYLVGQKANVDQADKRDSTPLMFAASRGDLPMVQYLVGQKAKVDQADDLGNTPMLYAAECGNLPVVEYFVDLQANKDHANKSGYTPLLKAASGGHLAVLKYLIGKGVNENQKNIISGSTALLEAGAGGHIFLLKYLIEEKKIALDVRDNNNKSIFDYAIKQPAVLLYLNTIMIAKQSSVASNSTSQVNNLVNSLGQISISLEIPYEELTLDTKLGQGGFGVVHKAKWQGGDVAVKTLVNSHFSEDLVVEFKHEASIMAKLRHPNIIQLYGVCIKNPYCMVMEFASKGALNAVLHSDVEIDWPQRLKIAAGIANGLGFLHKQNPIILHRDIKSMNILLDPAMRPMLTDFGLATVKDKTATTTSNIGGAVGSLHWMAPELLNKEGSHTSACDIYSLAIVLWEIASRKLPYENKTAKEIYVAVSLRDEREAIPDTCHVKYKKIIASCWHSDFTKRPAIKEVIQELESIEAKPSDSSGYMSLN